jgi:hypothetical protein
VVIDNRGTPAEMEQTVRELWKREIQRNQRSAAGN